MDSILSKRSSWAQNSILEEAPIAEKIEAEGHKVIEINRGDPPVYFPTPKYIIDAYIRALKESKTMYSRAQGIRPLIEAIERRYKTKYNVNLNAEDIIVTAGVTEALAFVNTALINPEESAFIFRPYYNQYVTQLRLNGGIPVFDYYDENNGWDLNLDTVRAALDRLKRKGKISKLKYMLITNPNNPTGTVLSKKVLEGIVDIANDYGVFLISDEIYDEIYYNDAKFTSISQLARGVPHMILNGASKDFDATGFRLGYAIIPEDDKKSSAIKGKLADLASVRLCVNTPAQYAFAAAMNNSKMHNREIKAMVKEIEKRVNSAVDILEENDFVRVVRPKGAFYILPRIDFKSLWIKDDREFVGKLLEEEHVMLSRGSGFGADSHVRIVALPPKNILDYAMNKINRFCKRYSK